MHVQVVLRGEVQDVHKTCGRAHVQMTRHTATARNLAAIFFFRISNIYQY